MYPVIFFTKGNVKERFGHISVTDIKDLKKQTEAVVSSTVADKLQHAQLKMEYGLHFLLVHMECLQDKESTFLCNGARYRQSSF
jgi:hypothetical protein